MININISKKIFNNIYLSYLENETRFEIFYGGAGSGKSRFVFQRNLLRHLKPLKRKTLIIRKVGRTSRHSTFAETTGLISEWDVNKLFKINKSDMEITCMNGNKMIFSGLDDVEKLKSISGITDIIIEEATEISEDDLNQLNLRLRGKTEVKQQITMMFNPISALHWIKKRFFDLRSEDVTILKTTYKDNKFLNQDYIKQIENLKTQDPVYYEIYALGNWGVLGNLVYTNYEVFDFDCERFFNNSYAGLDWGFNDPSAYIKVAYYDSELWVWDEYYRSGLTNSELMNELESEKKQRITADSSEPARIKEFKQNGFKINEAIKGKDSIKFGIDFIRRHKINIHTKCSNFLKEIQGYSYRKDKDGNVLEEPVDFNNHLMDALRYALEELSKNRNKIKWLR